ncbi:MAG: tRNA uridine-5-carboxymethylaminomethyl(34) synthesis enzyme MnmG [Acidobacteria bacterium]|nr:tRNA uridine-5-carboxymethylaminomethyl(34) synthesis enzyme MnmG [Acidobacteriota bacterium]
MSFDEKFDVIVIGAGHAGCEAASAAARMGAQTALITLNLDLIGQMSCNPAIGGIAKGNLVREVDALGGIMGKVIDRTGIQFRLLNRSRGPAVRSPRAQADRALYRTEMRATLESTHNLYFRQGLVVDLIIKNGQIYGAELQDTRRIRSDAVVLATGTFLNGLIHTGKRTYAAGRAGEPAATELAGKLKELGFPIGRLKTGTPPRLDGRSIDWEKFEPQPGDEEPVPFSFSTAVIEQPQVTCFIGYTNEGVHRAIRDNISESPLYSGQIKGIGPRYCPSIEDKVVKFPDKNRHQLFLEPEGYNTFEIYLNGFSTSLPPELQQELVNKISGLEEAQIIRPGYAIEYDFIDPKELDSSLQSTRIKGLFLAGQINGTTGYEEAACQGLLAGVNAVLYVKKQASFQLSRSESYIGVLVDDLIRHGVDEPYRMFTSRAESRLSLRYDTSDIRLTFYGRQFGLITDSYWESFNARRFRLNNLVRFLKTTYFKRSDAYYSKLSSLFNSDFGDSINLAQLLKRPEVPFTMLFDFVRSVVPFCITSSDLQTAFADILYEGYLDSQSRLQSRIRQYDELKFPLNLDFRSVNGVEVVSMIHLPRKFRAS